MGWAYLNGPLMMGIDYAYLSLTSQGSQWQIAQTTCRDADKLTLETGTAPTTVALGAGVVYLRVTVAAGAKYRFRNSVGGQHFEPVGEEFKARE